MEVVVREKVLGVRTWDMVIACPECMYQSLGLRSQEERVIRSWDAYRRRRGLYRGEPHHPADMRWYRVTHMVGKALERVHFRYHAASRGIGILRPQGKGLGIDPDVWVDARGEAKAHVRPSVDNGAGLYAYTLEEFLAHPHGLNGMGCGVPVGVLELSGIVIEHADGVLRGEYARIREVFVLGTAWAEYLRRHYRFPVHEVTDPDQIRDALQALLERQR